LRARGILLGAIALMFAAGILAELANRTDLVESTVANGLVMYGSIALVLLVRGRRTGLDWRRLFGRPLERGDAPLFFIIIPLAALSIGSFWVFWYPISFVAPNAVRGALESLSRLMTPGSPMKVLVEGLIIAVVAPIVEEVFFRGVLLHRWATRWDLRTGIVLSSILFALVHLDPIGKFVFGLAMCALYLRTGSLWAPIAAHAINNGIVFLMVAPKMLRGETSESYTLEAFRGDWGSSLASFVVGLVVLIWFARRYLRGIGGRLPYFAGLGSSAKDDPSLEVVPAEGSPAALSSPDANPPY
jgi:membrane protease YdiL (CAAX protease family)